MNSPFETSAAAVADSAVQRVVARLHPTARQSLPDASLLADEGRELVDLIIRPLAQGGGPLDAAQIEAGVAHAAAHPELIDALLHHKADLLGGFPPQDLGNPIDWFRAPDGDWQWPTHLSRHYWLAPLAYAWHLHRDPAYAEHLVDILLDWIDKTPLLSPQLDNRATDWALNRPADDARPATLEGYFFEYMDGPWTSLSAHCRADWWTRLLQLIWDAPCVTNAVVARLLDSLLGDHIEVMLCFPRQMNQFQGVATSLVYYGFYYPQFTASQEAARAGWERLELYVQREIYPDGSVAECSPNYGLMCVQRLLNVAENAGRHGRQIPALFKERICLAARYYAFTADPTGCSPRIAKGGADIGSDLTRLNTLAKDPHIAFVASKGKTGHPAAQTSISFPWAGHHVLRSGWNPGATWLFFETGPRGTGHHDDARLGLQLKVGAQWLLVDPGFYTYSGQGYAGRMGRYLHSTAAHNTAVVDGLSQKTRKRGEIHPANTRPGDSLEIKADGTVQVAGDYTDGFGPDGALQVGHRRQVVYSPDRARFEITDSFAGDGRHEVALHWQAPPDATVEIEPGAVWIRGQTASLRIEFACAQPLEITAVAGGEQPLLGWFSFEYGQLRPTTTIRVRTATAAALPLTVHSLLKILA